MSDELARRDEILPARKGIGSLLKSVLHRGEERKYEEARREILRRYAAISDPELRRMTIDIMNALETKALSIETASDAFVPPFESLGTYNLTLGGNLEVTATCNAGYRQKTLQGIMELHGWKNACSLGVNIAYESQGNRRGFDNLPLDIATLGRFMPARPDSEDYLSWDPKNRFDAAGLENAYAVRTVCSNSKQHFDAKVKWSNGKLSHFKQATPDRPDTFSFGFDMDQPNIPAFIRAVQEIKSALTEPEKHLTVPAAKQLPPASRR